MEKIQLLNILFGTSDSEYRKYDPEDKECELSEHLVSEVSSVAFIDISYFYE